VFGISKRFNPRSHTFRWSAFATVLLLVVGAGASVSGSPRFISGKTAETIYACVKNSTGAMRMVAANKPCKKGETRWQWSGSGIQGPAGATGAQGPAGATGPQGPAGSGSSASPSPTATSGFFVKDSTGDVMGDWTGEFSTSDNMFGNPPTYASSGFTMLLNGTEVRVGVSSGRIKLFLSDGSYLNPWLYYEDSSCSGTPMVDKSPYDTYGPNFIKFVLDQSGGARTYQRSGNFSVTPVSFGSNMMNGTCTLSGEQGREVYPVILVNESTVYTAPLVKAP
jgi:hypothetical protein